jgi:amino acid adenylation domain-containing protein
MSELASKSGAAGTGDSLASRPGRTCISYAQEQIWIAEQLAPDCNVYGLPMVFHLRGDFDVELAARSVTDIVRRHEILRSRVLEDNGELFTVIDGERSVDLPVLDLRGHREAWLELVESAAREPFDLAAGPLLRVQVLRLDEKEYVFFLHVHHMVADGWSLRLFWAEFAELYSARCVGTEPRLPELTVQYGDFAVEQRRVAESGGYNEELRIWLDELAGAPTTLELPADHRRDGQHGYAGSEVQVTVPDKVRAEVFGCARRLKVTPSTLMCALWGVLLARCSRAEDLLVGVPLLGRTRPEFEKLIGMFVNTMPLRMRPAADKIFSDFAREVQFAALDALAGQDVPFIKLADEIRSVRVGGSAPLFQSLYSFEESEQFGAALAECEVIHVHEVPNGAARFSINLSVVDTFGKLNLQFAYDSRLLDAVTVAGMAETYLALLADAVVHPDRPIGRLRTSDQAEPDRVMAGCPQWPDERLTLHGLFEDTVKRTPDAPAVEREDGSRLSYRVLNRQANQLARLLCAAGLTAGERVAIALPRGSSWPAAVLAVLKAGGSYVPVTPGVLAERTAHVLAEVTPRFVVTLAEHADATTGKHRMLVLDDPAVISAIAAHSGEDLEDVGTTGRHVAYIPFTSGSTGMPKGTLLTHANLVSFTISAVEAFEFGPSDRILQIAAMTFDVHIEEFFPAWAVGGCLVFPQDALSRTTANRLLAILRDREITLCELPTAYWLELVHSVNPTSASRPERMRRLLVGGERIPAAAYRQWLKFGIPLTNVYGLTETAVTSTTYQPSADFDRDALPVGQPMPHAAAYLLDESLAPVGRGLPGEIYLGGPGISLGLLNLSAQTAARFLPDPFSGEPGARMYRTGDYGRVTGDGQLEFLGRTDRQLKIYGHRVELAEIEAVLDAHPDVLQAVVVPRKMGADKVDEIQLNAFLVGEDIDEHAIVQFARARLPGHMVPGLIRVIDRFPVTVHGKVDQDALLALAVGDDSPQRQDLGTELELQVASIYRAVLKVESIDMKADIFSLGFQSLSALRLASRIQREFNVNIPMGEFFADSSVAALAQIIAAAGE